jgi:hypothetical protein
MAKKKTPPEVFERQRENIRRLRRLLERNPGEFGRSPTMRESKNAEVGEKED